MTDVKVEQCDRDAAADWFGQSSAGKIRSGEHDNPLVAAFARHRQAAEKAQQERDAGVVKAHPMRFVGMTESYIRDTLATAIRSQGHE